MQQDSLSLPHAAGYPTMDQQKRKAQESRDPEKGRYKQEVQQSYRSFSTTLMTEMLKVVNHATRLINSTPPSAFCL
jgi:DNA replication initiation complex subunit (GINS family)